MSRFGNWVDKLFEKHKFARRAALFWAMGLITWCTVAVYEDISLITNPVTVIYGITVGILSTVVGWYIHTRNQDDRNS